MSDKVSRTVLLDPQTDKDLADLAYNLKLNRQEVIEKLIEKGLDDGILEKEE